MDKINLEIFSENDRTIIEHLFSRDYKLGQSVCNVYSMTSKYSDKSRSLINWLSQNFIYYHGLAERMVRFYQIICEIPGINLNEQDSKGKTPLLNFLSVPHFSYDKTEEIVSLLLANGSDVNICDQFGLLPLHCLFINSYDEFLFTNPDPMVPIAKKIIVRMDRFDHEIKDMPYESLYELLYFEVLHESSRNELLSFILQQNKPFLRNVNEWTEVWNRILEKKSNQK